MKILNVNVKQLIECRGYLTQEKREKNQYNKIFEKVKNDRAQIKLLGVKNRRGLHCKQGKVERWILRSVRGI